MTLAIRPFEPGDAEAMRAWRYPPPYDFYNDDDRDPPTSDGDDRDPPGAPARDRDDRDPPGAPPRDLDDRDPPRAPARDVDAPPNDEVVHRRDRDASLADHHAIVEDGELVGFCSFGADGRVPGGTYPDGPLDLGMGMRPDLTGRGLGARYLAAVIDHAQRELGATALRATVAEVNARAIRLCERAGFRRVARFDGVERAFWILVRD